MSLVYRLLYRVGFTPWDTGDVPAELSALVQGETALAPERALDIGCGTGTHSLYLARNGWQVTGIEAVEQAIRRARARSAVEGLTVDWIRADATRLRDVKLTPGFSLMLDRGCYHGLSSPERAAYTADVTELARAGATLLMMAFARNRVPLGPAGAQEAEIVAAFDAWKLVSAEPDSGPAPAGPLRNVPRRWYHLVRN